MRLDFLSEQEMKVVRFPKGDAARLKGDPAKPVLRTFTITYGDWYRFKTLCKAQGRNPRTVLVQFINLYVKSS